MEKDLGLPRVVWNLLKQERRPILLGFALGTAVSALIPQLVSAYDGLAKWVWNPDHLQKIAVNFFIGIIVVSALVLYRGHKMLKATPQAVELPYNNRVKLTGMRVSHHPVEFRPGLPRPRHSNIGELASYDPPAANYVLANLRKLHIGVLFVCGDSRVYRDSAYRGIHTNPSPSLSRPRVLWWG